MTNAKDSQTENPNIYYAIILLAIGLVIYKWFNEVDKTLLINTLIQLGIAILVVLWFVAIIFFYIRGDVLEKQKSKIIAKILIHITNFSVIILFIYRFAHPHIVSIFFIIHGLIALFLFMYYNYNIPKNLQELWKNYQWRKWLAQSNERELTTFLESELKKWNLQELESKKKDLITKKYSKSLIQKYPQYNKKLKELDYLIEKRKQETEIAALKAEKDITKKEVTELLEEKEKLSISESTEKAILEYRITHREENIILSHKLTREEKTMLKRHKHKQINEYCPNQNKILTVFVRPVMGHSATHTFLVWSIKRLLEDFDVTKIEEHDTKDADVTFIHRNKKYAIEIETGTLLKKIRQLKNKTHMLNNKYPKRWFFLVSNRNLQAQYKQYGTVTQRNRVRETIRKMLENTHPK